MMPVYLDVVRCRAWAELYARLYQLCRQLTTADGDAATCCALASQERESERRREAVEKVRQHNEICKICGRKV